MFARRCVSASCIVALLALDAGAYNNQQHQGIVALAYKALAAAALESGCAAPIDFGAAPDPPSLRTLPPLIACQDSAAGCSATWNRLMARVDHTVRFLHALPSALPAPPSGCDYHTWQGGGTLVEVPRGFDAGYHRGGGCAVSVVYAGDQLCDNPANLCQPGSIFQYLAPYDHSGSALGYWATEPDNDESVTATGVKPINVLGIGHALNDFKNYLEDGLGAAFAGAYCAVSWIWGDDDCVGTAKHVADDAVPIEELTSLVPVLGATRDGNRTTVWHFQQMASSASNFCDDHQGLFYEEAGPERIPSAIDLGIMAVTDLAGITLNYDDSTGPKRFNITSPGDGQSGSCSRDKADWELGTLGATAFSPIDNLALWGWRRFTESGDRNAAQLGWPLHAIGDAVAPHHVVGTTGWGHRPYEDAVEVKWQQILYEDLGSAQAVAQYEQLRRIWAYALGFYNRIETWRAVAPGTGGQHVAAVRRLVTMLATQTYDEVVQGGLPQWPLVELAPFTPNYNLSLEYFFKLEGQAVSYYTDDPSAAGRMRPRIERGAGAALALLVAAGENDALSPNDGPRCGSDGLFASCGPGTCTNGCCLPDAPPQSCSHPCTTVADCPAGYSVCWGSCCTAVK